MWCLEATVTKKGQNNQKVLISKKTTLQVQHTFLYISLLLFFTTTSRSFQKIPNYTFYVFLFTFFSTLPLTFNLVAASISTFSHRRYKIFMFFFQWNWSPLFFISPSSSFGVIHVTLDTKIKSEERIGFVVVVFISKSPGSYAIYRRNARVLEMQNFIQAYLKGWTYVRTYSVRTIFSEPKFLGCIDYQIFLPMVLRWARFTQ